jgi:SHS2 domain-containing protein
VVSDEWRVVSSEWRVVSGEGTTPSTQSTGLLRQSILTPNPWPLPPDPQPLIPTPMYEIFEHTADLGLRIRADDLGRLFAEAGCALFSVIAADLGAVRAVDEVRFRIEGAERDELLRDWLAELLYTFHARRLLLAQFEVRVDDAGLTATARGEPIDLGRHGIDTEVKAVTYHGLKVQQDQSGWLAEVILDI